MRSWKVNEESASSDHPWPMTAVFRQADWDCSASLVDEVVRTGWVRSVVGCRLGAREGVPTTVRRGTELGRSSGRVLSLL